MLKRMTKYCKENGIYVFYKSEGNKFVVSCEDAVLYQSSSYGECIEYIMEMMIVDKYTNNR